MSKDIVERMRFWSKTRNDNPTPWNLDCGYAADAIERLTAERDEARRMYCGRVSRDVPLDAFGIAKNHGWDCFPLEDGK
ncbi:MAG: hypothetical protein ACK528_13965 [Alphaproteobacteria bacterium]